MIGSLPVQDWAVVLRLMAVLALASWAARPLAQRLTADTGWIPSILLAWIVMGWVPWALAALHLVPFATASFAGLLGLGAFRLKLGPGRATPPRSALLAAMGFAGLFWLGLAQRTGHIDLSGLEKFTDMGFLAAVMRADFMPPQDAWYAGSTINYYYVGQAMAAAWGHIAGATAANAYQLAMASLFALTGLSVWHITARLSAPAGPRLAQAFGGLAAALTLYGGNFHSTLYLYLRPLFPATNDQYYFPESTRFIGFDPPADDHAFTEFPAYAFSVGDLHAHVAALPVFFLGVMILLALLNRTPRAGTPDLIRAAGLGWVLGLCGAINSWDVAILGMMALFAGAVMLVRARARRQMLDGLGAAAVLAGAMCFLVMAPFLGWFEPFASGVVPAPNRTPIWQLLVLYGHTLLPIALYAALLWKIPALRRHRVIGWLFVSAVALIIIPEVMIVRDIYGLDYARANTMFKLTFRAQTLLIIAGVSTLALAVPLARKWRGAALVAALPLVSILSYAQYVFIWPSTIQGLDGLGFLGDERALVAHAGGLPLSPGEAFIEASGSAFGDTARVSAMTGQPVVVGWAAHEWLWRNDNVRPNARAHQVELFYTTDSQPLRCAIVRRYTLRYAILGQVEQTQYGGLNAAGVRALGPILHDDEGGQIVQIDPRTCD